MNTGLIPRILGLIASASLLALSAYPASAKHSHARTQVKEHHAKEHVAKADRHGKASSKDRHHGKKSSRDEERSAKAERSGKRLAHGHEKGRHHAVEQVASRQPAKLGPPRPAPAKALESEFDSLFAAPQKSGPLPAVTRSVAPRPATVSLFSPPQVRQNFTSPFEASIAQLADATQGRIGVAAIDLGTGRSVAVLGDQPFPMASTSKVAIVATYLAGVDAGRLTLNQQFPLLVPVPSKKFDGSAAPVRPSAMMPAIDLIEAAITHSDNHATDALLAAVGGPSAVTRWVQSTTGISEFHLDRTIATLVRDDGAVNPATMIDRRDSVTPLAMVRLLSGLYRGQWLSPQSRDVLMGAMSRTVTGRHRIKALLPEGTQVAHKTGTLSNTSSDIGFIRTADGRDLVVAIYVTGQGGKQGRDARIAALARAIYDGYQTEPSGDRRTVLR